MAKQPRAEGPIYASVIGCPSSGFQPLVSAYGLHLGLAAQAGMERPYSAGNPVTATAVMPCLCKPYGVTTGTTGRLIKLACPGVCQTRWVAFS